MPTMNNYLIFSYVNLAFIIQMAKDITSKRLWDSEVTNLPPLDLTLVQRESYQWFLENEEGR